MFGNEVEDQSLALLNDQVGERKHRVARITQFERVVHFLPDQVVVDATVRLRRFRNTTAGWKHGTLRRQAS